jgi:hypothetical protein
VKDDGKDCGKMKGAETVKKAANQGITFSSNTNQVCLAFILG